MSHKPPFKICRCHKGQKGIRLSEIAPPEECPHCGALCQWSACAAFSDESFAEDESFPPDGFAEWAGELEERAQQREDHLDYLEYLNDESRF